MLLDHKKKILSKYTTQITLLFLLMSFSVSLERKSLVKLASKNYKILEISNGKIPWSF